MRARQRHFNAGSAGAAACYDARFLALSNNDAVDSWTDRSGNGRNATQATSTKKPTFKTGVTGGAPAISFDGGDCLVTSSYSGTPSFTIICTFSATANGLVYERGTNFNVAGDHFIYTTQGACSYCIGSGTYPATATGRNAANNWGIGGTWRVVAQEIKETHASNELYVNGPGVTIANAPGETNNPGTSSYSLALNIGARNNAGSLGLTGQIGALAHFSPALETPLRKRLERQVAYSFKIACS